MYETSEDLEGLDLTGRQRWGLERGEKLRRAFSAALENRPWHDTTPERMEPIEPTE